MVFSLSDTWTPGSISGLHRTARRYAHSMSLHKRALLPESKDGYGSSFDQIDVPRFNLVAREGPPNIFLITCSSW